MGNLDIKAIRTQRNADASSLKVLTGVAGLETIDDAEDDSKRTDTGSEAAVGFAVGASANSGFGFGFGTWIEEAGLFGEDTNLDTGTKETAVNGDFAGPGVDLTTKAMVDGGIGTGAEACTGFKTGIAASAGTGVWTGSINGADNIGVGKPDIEWAGAGWASDGDASVGANMEMDATGEKEEGLVTADTAEFVEDKVKAL